MTPDPLAGVSPQTSQEANSAKDAEVRGVTAYITGSQFLWHPTELPWDVSFFALHKALPIYHDPGGASGREDEQEDGRYAFRMRTKCGLVTYEDKVGPGGQFIEASEVNADDRVPSRHAVRFGKPCLKCWPEIAAVMEDEDD